MFAQLQQIIIHLPLRHDALIPPLTVQLRAMAQLDQTLQLLVAETQALASCFLSSCNDGISSGEEHVVEACAAAEHRFGLDVLQVLLEDQDVQLHATAAISVHALDVRRVDDEEGVG